MITRCIHSEAGWCLGCVKELNDDLEHANHRIEILLQEREQVKILFNNNNIVVEKIKNLLEQL